MTKKEMYDNSLYDLRTYINGDIAIKPYFYLRNGLLHCRYTVDRAIELSDSENIKLKVDITTNPSNKQEVLEKAWNFFTTCVNKTVIADGIRKGEERMKELTKKYTEKENNGYKN